MPWRSTHREIDVTQIAGSRIDAMLGHCGRFGIRLKKMMMLCYKMFHMMTNLCLQKMVLEQKIGSSLLPTFHLRIGTVKLHFILAYHA